jgi:hypothetical protein
VLSVELDAIRVEDIEYLYDTYGLRHVTPVHFTDNEFGGAAVYNDVFAVHAAAMRRIFGATDAEYFELVEDASISHRAGRPLVVERCWGYL